MVYPWNPRDDPSKAFGSGFSNMYPLGAPGVIVFIEVDNRKCNQVRKTLSGKIPTLLESNLFALFVVVMITGDW